MQICTNRGVVLLVSYTYVIEYYVTIRKSEKDANVLIWNVLQDIPLKQGEV